MNMKKTIAALSAATVAVSAMATTINAAFETQTLTFNLVEMTRSETKATATYTKRWTATAAETKVKLDLSGVSAANADFGDHVWTLTYTRSGDSNRVTEVYSKKAGAASTVIDADVTTDVSSLTFPEKTFEADSEVVASVTVKHDLSVDAYKTSDLFAEDIAVGSSTASSPAFCTVAAASNGDWTPTYPMKTDLNGTELLNYLSSKKLTSWGGSYGNVTAVLNDAAVNYDDISVTFKTATQKVKADDNGRIKYSTDGDASDKYMKFGQNLYGSTQTGYINYNWTGFNLFNGALVLNKHYTMSLSDINAFVVNSDGLTFSWNTLMTTNSGAAINPYAQFITTLDFITSTEWYWDSVSFVLENKDVEDLDLGEGVDGETDTLDEDDIDEDDEEIDADDIDEDETEEVEVEVEDVPVDNAETGNASVALAVIPVALAAAAIVAKKRG